eukprot:tig00000806_g4331.t1
MRSSAHVGLGLTSIGVRTNPVFYASWRGEAPTLGAAFVFAHRLNGTGARAAHSAHKYSFDRIFLGIDVSVLTVSRIAYSVHPDAVSLAVPVAHSVAHAVPLALAVPVALSVSLRAGHAVSLAYHVPGCCPDTHHASSSSRISPHRHRLRPPCRRCPPRRAQSFITMNETKQVVIGSFTDGKGNAVYRVDLNRTEFSARQTGSGANEFIRVPVTGVLAVGANVEVSIVSVDGKMERPATEESVVAEGSNAILQFKAPALARRRLLQFAANTAYDLRIDPATGAPAFVPIVIGKAFQWTPVGTSASVPYRPNAAASTYASSLFSSFLCGLVSIAVALALHAAT